FLKSGQYGPKASVQTLANAMDVGNPSNWVRIQDLFHNNLSELQGMISSYTYNDGETKKGMDELYEQFKYVACPHTAIAYLASKAYRKDHPGEYASLLLSTAHPCTIPESIAEDVYKKVKLTAGAEKLQGKPKLAEELKVDYDAFKAYLIENN